MKTSLLGFFTGRVLLSGSASDAPAFLDLCMRYAIPYADISVLQDGTFTVLTSYRAAKRARAVAARCGITLSVKRRSGILSALSFCLSRPGIPIGIVLALCLTVVASTHLWEIRVTGNETVSRREVVRALSAAGLRLGGRMDTFDVDAIENALLRNSEKISWITVNLMGNVAQVQIREKLPTPPVEETAPANLVAREDGVIAMCEVLRGNLLVKVGTAVKRGEVLVSGVYDSATLGYRLTRAAGAIYAETEHVFRIEVPYAYKSVVQTGRSETHYRLLFFGREIPLGGMNGTADVTRVSYLSVFGKELPIGIAADTVYEYGTQTGIYDAERAMEIAYDRLAASLAAIPGMQGVLEKSIGAEILDDRYILNCKVRCIENIAETKNIEIGALG